MDHRVDQPGRELKPLIGRELRWWTWKRVLLVSIVILALLEIGTYAFNWQWTGFRDHGRVWDWLSLLLVPVIVALLPIWYSIRMNRQKSQTRSEE
jgi:hypothetical protein